MNNQVSNVVSVLSGQKEAIEQSLPSHISYDKFRNVAITASMTNPDLNQATMSSLATAFIQCAKDSLLPDGKEAAIVIYNKKQGSQYVKVANYIPMVQGVIKRLRQSGEVEYINSKVVYAGDHFDYQMTSKGEDIEYKPTFIPSQRGEVVLAFAIARLKSGEAVVEIMPKEDIDKIMRLSKSSIDKKTGKVVEWSVWGQFYNRMAEKTVIHALAKRLPNSSEVRTMLERDIDIQDVTKKEDDAVRNNDNVVTIEQDKLEHKGLSQERINELKAYVDTTSTDESQMFAFISSQSGSVVNSYKDLNEQQADQLLELLMGKVKQQQGGAMMAQSSNQAIYQG